MGSIFNGKIYLNVSKWGYPFGGGEEFLLQTMMWARNLGMRCYWISFYDRNNKPYEDFAVESHEYGKIIKIPDGASSESIECWLRMIKPDIVHHQGHMRRDFYEVCDKLRIEFLTGFHFWMGCIKLSEKTMNRDILENSHLHRADEELAYLWGKRYCNYYTVSEFVSECIKKITGYDIKGNIYASSSYKNYKIENLNPHENKYVTMVNIHKFKGGEILLHVMNKLGKIPFFAIKTEPGSEELDSLIEELIKKRRESGIDCIITNRVEDLKEVYKQTKILLIGSQVDETFCRVANEGMLNGIPIITTGKGNIKHLVKDKGIIIHESKLDDWVNTIDRLYHNDDLIKEYSKRSLDGYAEFSEEKAILQFKSVIGKVITKSKSMNIMIMCPWCDQGLGIQSRNYGRILESEYNVYIFALKPYNANTCIELQKDPSEWSWSNIYYSPNDRERVKDSEIISFVMKNNIGKCILPETCWFRVFEIARLLSRLNVKCYAVPNIEIVRKDEINKHRYFYKILCNNLLCKSAFKRYGIKKTEYIGYGFDDPLIKINPTQIRPDGVVKFLFVGGMNAFSRKQVLGICQAFAMLDEKYRVSLTCTIQKFNDLKENDKNDISLYMKNPKITFIEDHLPYKKIIDLYYEHHISIQVSKHEGLGLGFYEALGTGTPVITLSVPPHNEIVRDGINGWIVDSYYKKMEDNNDSLIESAYFDPKKLSNKISLLLENFDINYTNVIRGLVADHSERLHIDKFRERLFSSLN
jgi:glycosyltransferase involved in cell wall biosynthesis